jgi:hypothetical protein
VEFQIALLVVTLYAPMGPRFVCFVDVPGGRTAKPAQFRHFTSTRAAWVEMADRPTAKVIHALAPAAAFGASHNVSGGRDYYIVTVRWVHEEPDRVILSQLRTIAATPGVARVRATRRQ